jgi:hypothetical protein
MVENKDNSEFKNAAIIIVACLVGGILALIFIGKPLYESIVSNEKVLAEKTTYSKNLTDKLEKLQSLKKDEADIKEKNKTVLSALPIDKEVSRLYVQFEKVAEASGLRISRASENDTVDPKAATGSTPLVRNVKYTTEAKSGSGYLPIKDALKKYEQALRLLAISEITLLKPSSNNEMTVNFNLTTYVRSE